LRPSELQLQRSGLRRLELLESQALQELPFAQPALHLLLER
jgi:hypothetical protein